MVYTSLQMAANENTGQQMDERISNAAEAEKALPVNLLPSDREKLSGELPPQSPATADDRVAGARDFADMSPEEQKEVLDGLEELRAEEAEYRRIDARNKAIQAEQHRRQDWNWMPPDDWEPPKTENQS